ncbi:TPA: glycosyltransferase, partial [Streptococcus suis]
EAGEWLYGDKEFQIIRNAIDIEKFEFRLATRERIREELNLKGKFVVGHIGRLSYQKNQAFLIDIFSEFNKMNPESVLILVGGGYRDNELEKKAKQLSLIGKIIFLGEREDVSEILNCFDVFVFPSRFEGLGIVV